MAINIEMAMRTPIEYDSMKNFTQCVEYIDYCHSTYSYVYISLNTFIVKIILINIKVHYAIRLQ